MWRYAAVNILIACDQVEAGWPLWWEVCFEGDTTNPSTPNCLAPTWVQPEYYKMKWVWQWNFYSLLNVYVSFNMIIIQTLLYNNNCVCVTLCTPHLPTWISLWWTQAMQSDPKSIVSKEVQKTVLVMRNQFSAAKAALGMQMSVSQSVSQSVCQ